MKSVATIQNNIMSILVIHLDLVLIHLNIATDRATRATLETKIGTIYFRLVAPPLLMTLVMKFKKTSNVSYRKYKGDPVEIK